MSRLDVLLGNCMVRITENTAKKHSTVLSLLYILMLLFPWQLLNTSIQWR